MGIALKIKAGPTFSMESFSGAIPPPEKDSGSKVIAAASTEANHNVQKNE
jgi:hypothetical protein